LHIVLYANRLGAACSALMTLAATRGRLCELLAEAIQPRCYIKPYVAFTVGALSFADVVLNLDVANIVDQIGESSEVCGALNARAGVYGDLLTLVELYEMPELFDADKINRLLDQFQLSKREFFHMQKQAFSWGSSISEYMSIQLADQ